MACIFLPRPMPKVNVATIKAISITIGAREKKKITSSYFETAIIGSRVITANKITGSSAVRKLFRTPGSSCCFRSGGLKVSRGFDSMFLSVRENMGPATMIVGIAMTIPYSMVSPRSALNCPTSVAGEGCGGKKNHALLTMRRAMIHRWQQREAYIDKR